MNNPLLVAVAITAAGMTLLFLALGFFYGLLSLISSAFGDKARPAGAPEPTEQAAPNRPPEPELMLQAAAIAVALARAEGGTRSAPAPAAPLGGPVSPWWALHQGNRVAAGTSPWRRS